MKISLHLLPLTLLFACGEGEKTDDTAQTEDTSSEDTGIQGTDNDGDGVTVEEGDCNDEDASIYPGATEDFTDGIDQDCDGYADVGDANCDAQFTIVFEGADSSEEVNLDFCRKWSMTNTYEYDPDNPPELNSISLDLNATDDSDFQCQLRIEQSGVCGEGYYRMGLETGTAYYASMDCSGVSDENEAEFNFANGYLRLDTINTGTESGSFSGEPLKTEISGHLHVWGANIDIEGNIGFIAEQIANDSEENECSILNEEQLDADEDGYISSYYDREDCDDNNPNTFPGAAPNDDPNLCLQDNDGDDYGSVESGGTDCDDNNEARFPGNPEIIDEIRDNDCDETTSFFNLTPPSGAFTQVSSGAFHSCAIKTDNTISCWGNDNYNQVSDTPSGAFTQVSSAGFHSCAIKTDNTITCWGINDGSEDDYGIVSNAPSGTFTQVSSGIFHSCAIKTDNTISCWGYDGDGIVSNAPSGTFTQVSSGYSHSCAIKTDNTISCWGSDGYGIVSNAPSGTFTQVSSSGTNSCAIKTDNTISCWGYDGYDIVSNAPSGTFTQVSSEDWNSCAIKTDNTISCWGYDGYGIVSNAPSGAFTQVSSGKFHSCAIKTDNTISCWGEGIF